MLSPEVSVLRASTSVRLWTAYLVEACSSIGAQMLMVGIYFYTSGQLGWTRRDNFLLAAGQGVVYVCGALMSSRTTARLGHRGLLLGLHVILALIAGMVALNKHHPAVFVSLLITYTFFSAGGWPALESLVSGGCDPHALSRRLAIYNLIWSGTGAVTVAITGALLTHWANGIFLVPMAMHLISLALLFIGLRGNARSPAPALPDAHAEPEPDLLHSRKLALWLSRVVLPAEYVVIYSTVAMMPFLSIVRELPQTQQTLLGSVWMTVRWLTFLVLGLSVWWHTRPRLLLAAALAMLIGFIAIAVRPSDVFPASFAVDLASIVIAQIILGIALGLIYTASLYFGMVLSEGSTEHGGYHEALIGLGSVLGPGSGAIALTLYPGSPIAGTAAVSIVIAASVLLAAGMSIRLRKTSAR